MIERRVRFTCDGNELTKIKPQDVAVRPVHFRVCTIPHVFPRRFYIDAEPPIRTALHELTESVTAWVSILIIVAEKAPECLLWTVPLSKTLGIGRRTVDFVELG